MKGAPPTKHQILDAIDISVRAVDRAGRDMDQRWGIGRLTTLVPIDLAERFRAQQRKFSAAVWEREPEQVRKHADAMLRAYAKLDEVAVAGGAVAAPPEQWEFQSPDGLIVLVRELADVGRAELNGRAAQVWSLDEIASVIHAHPTIIAAKEHFPGAIIESVRPDPKLAVSLNDQLMDIPFS